MSGLCQNDNDKISFCTIDNLVNSIPTFFSCTMEVKKEEIAKTSGSLGTETTLDKRRRDFLMNIVKKSFVLYRELKTDYYKK